MGLWFHSLTPVVDQFAGTSGHSSWPLPFLILSSGSDDRSVLRQHDGSGVPLGPRGDVFPLGGVASDFSCTSIHHEHQECHSVFLEPSSTGPRLRVDPGSRCSDGPFCHLFELSPSGVLFSIQQSHVTGDRHSGYNFKALSSTPTYLSLQFLHLTIINFLHTCLSLKITNKV